MDKRDVFDYMLYQMMSLCPRNNAALILLQGSTISITVQVVGICNTIKRSGGDPFVLRSGEMINMLSQLAVVILRDNRRLEMNVAISEEEGLLPGAPSGRSHCPDPSLYP